MKQKLFGTLGGRVVLIFIVSAVVFLILSGLSILAFFSYVADSKAKVAAEELKTLATEKINDRLAFLSAVATTVAENTKIIEAFEKDNYTIAEEEMRNLVPKLQKVGFKNPRFHLIKADMITLYRSYSEKRGDDTSSRALVRKVINDKKPVTGFEIATSGLQLRALVPVFQPRTGELLGIIDLHGGLDNIHRDFRAMNVHYIVLVDRKAVDEEKYKQATGAVAVGNYLTAHGRWFEPQTVEFAKLIDYDKLLQREYLVDGKVFATFNELKDFEGKTIGIEVYGMDAEVFKEKFEDIRWGMTLFTAIVFALFIAIMLIVLVFIERSIVAPIKSVSSFVSTLGTDLTKKFSYNREDEIKALVDAFNNYIESFRKIIKDNMSFVEKEIQTVASDTKAQVEQTKKDISDQVRLAEQVSTEAERMGTFARGLSQDASTLVEKSSVAVKQSQDSRELLQKTVEAVESVNVVTQELSSTVEKLTKKASEIGNIVTLIKDIADQTNLLALNAAIEAARAGEQGRGFAVVADEVRKLAESTIRSTESIAEIITAIQQSTADVYQSMEKASAQVSSVTELIREVDKALENILGTVDKVKDDIARIATEIGKQSSISEKLVRVVEESATISKEIDNMSDKIKESIEKLYNASAKLRDEMKKFRV